MEKQGLRELLVRSVLDQEFRDLLATDPDAAVSGYDLPEAELSALRQGRGVIPGLTGVAAEAQPQAGAAAGVDVAQAAAQTAPPLTVRVLLRVMQSIDEVAGEQGRMHFTAAIQPIAGDADARAMPSPEVDAQALPGERLEDILLDIRIMPHVSRQADGSLEVSFRHAVLPVAAGAPQRPPVEAAAPEDLAGCAEAVRRAAPAERYAALLDLVGALGEEAGDG